MLDQTQGRPIKAVEEFAPGTLTTPDGRPVRAMSIYAGAPADGRPTYAVSLLLDEGQIRTAVSFYANGTLVTSDGRPVFAVALFDALGAPTGLGAPTLAPLGMSNLTIPENSANGTVLGTIAGRTGGSTLSLAFNPGGAFAINSGTGVITVASSAALNYEAGATLTITVEEALAGATNTPLTTDFLVTIGNVFEVVLGTLGGTFTLAENSAENQLAGSITGKTAGSTLELIDNAGGRVKLSGTSIVAGPVATDFESATSHAFQVRESHPDASATFTTTFSLSVTDVAEGGGGGTIATPSITTGATLPGDAPPPWDINFNAVPPAGAQHGDTIRLRYGTSEAAMLAMAWVEEVLDTELIEETDGTLAPALFAAEFDPWALAQTVGTTLWWQVMVWRDVSNFSDPSTAATYLLADGTPTATPFVDATGAALSTRVWSADITIAGLGTGAYARFTVGAGGQMRVTRSGEVTPEAATSDEVQVQNGDKLAVSVVSSGTASTAVNLQVFQRGTLYDTFTVTTAAPAGLDIQTLGGAQNSGTGLTYTFAGQSLGAEAPDRDIIVVVGRRAANLPTGVTVAGVAATLRESVIGDGTIDHSLSIWVARVPTGTTGDVVVTVPTSVSRLGICLHRMVNGDPVPKSSGDNVSLVSGTALSVTPTIGAGQILIGAALAGSTGQNFSWTNATEVYEVYLSGTNITHFSNVRNSTAGSPTVTSTLSGANESRVMIYAVFGAP